MGWFKKAFGFSSQDAGQDIAESLYTAANKPLEKLFTASDKYLGKALPGSVDKYATIPFKVMTPASWDEIQQPGAVLMDKWDTTVSGAPRAIRPYADVIPTALATVYGGPMAGAAVNTGMQAARMQQQQPEMDWNEVAKNAGINFGTAAIAQGANALLKPAASATNTNALSSFNNGTSSALASNAAPTTAAQAANAAGGTARAASTSANTMAAFNQGEPSALQSTADNTRSISETGAAAPASSLSQTPGANAVASSGIGQTLRTGATRVAEGLAKDQLATSLAPEASTAISGVESSEVPSMFGASGGLPEGALSRFGGNELLRAPTQWDEAYISKDEYDQGMQRIDANRALRESQTEDIFRGAGQGDPNQNSRYGQSLNDIQSSTEAEKSQYATEADLMNQYFAMKNYNNLSDEQMQAMIQDPSGLPDDVRTIFTSFAPLYNF